MSLVTEVYRATKTFPDTEKFGLTSQIRRSAVSIPSNISEGYGRGSLKEYIRFLHISISSLFELQTQLEISFNLEFIEKSKFTILFDSSKEIERMLSSLIRSLKSSR
jgi:four helix bundle protein